MPPGQTIHGLKADLSTSKLTVEQDDGTASELSQLRTDLAASRRALDQHKVKLAALAQSESALANLQTEKSRLDAALRKANGAVQQQSTAETKTLRKGLQSAKGRSPNT